MHCSSVLYGNTSQALMINSSICIKDKMFNVSEMIIQSMFCPISSADKPDWWQWRILMLLLLQCILISSLYSWSATDIFQRKQISNWILQPARSQLYTTDCRQVIQTKIGSIFTKSYERKKNSIVIHVVWWVVWCTMLYILGICCYLLSTFLNFPLMANI